MLYVYAHALTLHCFTLVNMCNMIGLLLSSIRSPDPVVFFEPKALYRSAVEEVPVGDYTVPLGVGKILREGTDVTIVGWGGQMKVLIKVSIHMYIFALLCLHSYLLLLSLSN